jgi:hypothetical protein
VPMFLLFINAPTTILIFLFFVLFLWSLLSLSIWRFFSVVSESFDYIIELVVVNLVPPCVQLIDFPTLKIFWFLFLLKQAFRLY